MPMPVDSADRNWRQKDLPRSSTHRRLSNIRGPHTCTTARPAAFSAARHMQQAESACPGHRLSDAWVRAVCRPTEDQV